MKANSSWNVQREEKARMENGGTTYCRWSMMAASARVVEVGMGRNGYI